MMALPEGALVERVGWTLLHFLWQGVLIAKLFTAARSLSRRSMGPRGRYGLACVALAAMALAPFITFALISSGSPTVAASGTAWSARPFAAADSRLASGQLIAAFPGLSQQMLPWIVTAWLCGVLAFSIRLAGGWAVAADVRHGASARSAPAEWQTRLDELVLRVRFSRPVQLLVSSLAHAPMAVGYLRPAILMPVGALTGLPPEQIEALLAHELAHILRHDYLINLLQGAAEALLFYHPCVWWISNEIRTERELCCDDFAVGLSEDVLTYARALAAVESQRVSRLRLAVAADGGSLAERIRRLLDPSHAAAHTQSSRGAAAALSILLLAGIGAAAMNRDSSPVPAVHSRRAPEIVLPPASPAPREADSHPANRASTRRKPAAVERARRSEEASPPLVAQSGEGFERNRDLTRPRIEEPRRVWYGNSEVWLWAPVEGEPVLDSIELRGMTEGFANELRSRLPIREGQRVSHMARERIGGIAREYGRQLEFSLVEDAEGGAVLRIHPPGSAGDPLVPKDGEMERKKK